MSLGVETTVRPIESAPLEITDVQMWDSVKGAGSTILRAAGIGPCTGIATYDIHTGIGHLAHIPEPRINKEMVEAFFTSVVTDASNPQSLNVWVRGCEPGDDPTYAYESQICIEEMLLANGLEQADLIWSDQGEIVGMTLDCNTGTCEITTAFSGYEDDLET